jgi:hypothetical protein
MYHSKILVSWLSSKSAYPELAYPTYDNTIGIIQDEDNIKHMNVIK